MSLPLPPAPFTPFYYDDLVGSIVVAERAFADRIKREWAVKIANSNSVQLESFIWHLAPEAQWCRKHIVFHYYDGKLRGSVQTNDLDLNKLEAILVKMRSYNGDGTPEGSDSVLELLRITILLAIIRQLRRQMAGLIG
jgi:hypothetical protein